jgi:hypothetical protein
MNLLTVVRAWLGSIPPARFVAAATPVITILAGYVATIAARYLPGVPGLTKTEVLVWGLGVALAAAGILHRWLIGQSNWEVATQAKTNGVGVGGSPLDHPALTDVDPTDAEPDIEDLASESAVADEERLKRE